MFPAAMDGQRHRFYRALYRLAVTKDEGLDDYLAELGRAHRKFGVPNGHYAAFRTALLAAAESGDRRDIALFYGAHRGRPL